MDALPYVDTLFQEYLLFRGFTKTLQAFNNDRQTDCGCGFQAEQLSNFIFGRLIPQHDSRGLVELLDFLQTNVFLRLNGVLQQQAAKLEVSLLRLLLVQAIESGKTDVAQRFFADFGDRLSTGSEMDEWVGWFALPFLQKPQAHSRFQVFFTKPWRQLVETSFRSFMAKAVVELPLPGVLRFNADRKQRHALQQRVDALQAEIDSLKRASTPSRLNRRASLDLDLAAAPLDAHRRSDGLSAAALRTASAVAGSAGQQQTHREPQPRPAGSALQSSGGAKGSREGHTSASPPREGDLRQLALGGEPLRSRLSLDPATVDSEVPGFAPARHDSETAATSLETPTLLSDASDSETEGGRPTQEDAASGRPDFDGTSSGAPSLTDGDGATQVLALPPAAVALARAATGSLGGVLGEQEALQGHETGIADVIFGPDGRNVASASTDGVVRIWAPQMCEGNADRSAVLLCGAPVHRLAWDTRADKVMLVGTEGKGVKAWHLDTKRMVAHMRPDAAFPAVADLACSPTDPSFVCASGAAGRSGGGRLSLWNLRAFRKVLAFKEEMRFPSLCFSPDGRTVAATGDDGKLRLLDLGTSVATTCVDIGQARGGPSFVRFVGSDGAVLMTLSPDGQLRAWDFAMPRAPTWSADVSDAVLGAPHAPRFAVSADGSELALTSAGGAVHVLSNVLRGAADLRRGSAQLGAIQAVAWHPARRIVATGSTDRSLVLSRILQA